MSYSKSYILLAISFFITILLFLVFLTSKPFENQNLLSEPNYKVLDGKPDSFLDKAPLSSAQITPVSPAITPMPPDNLLKSQESQIVFHVVDALGDAVNEGVITINGKPNSFKQGLFTIDKPDMATIQIAVTAEGYTDYKTEISADSVQEKNIVLEYLIDFKILVTDQNNKPAENATVSLWKGKAAERPVQDTCLVSIWEYNFLQFSNAHIKLIGGMLSFNAIDKPQSLANTYFAYEDNFAYPIVGDTIHSIGANCWDDRDKPHYQPAAELKIPYSDLQQHYSNKLKIWDTLYFSGNPEHGNVSDSKEKVEYIRSSEHGNYILTFPESNSRENIIESKTDKDGRALFAIICHLLYIMFKRGMKIN